MPDGGTDLNLTGQRDTVNLIGSDKSEDPLRSKN